MILYNVVFALDIFLLVFTCALTLAVTTVAWQKRRPVRHALLTGSGLSFMCLMAIFSMFATSFHHRDLSIFFFPPGLVLIIWGVFIDLRKRLS